MLKMGYNFTVSALTRIPVCRVVVHLIRLIL